jgi:hypothetical protein
MLVLSRLTWSKQSFNLVGIKINPLLGGYRKYRNIPQWFLGFITMVLKPKPPPTQKKLVLITMVLKKNQKTDSDLYNQSS